MCIPNKRPVIFILSVLLAACGGGGNEPSPSDNGKDRKQMLLHWIDNIINPSYSNFKVKLDAMVIHADAFADSPDHSTLSGLREAWAEAYEEWQKVELFEFGATDKYTLRNFFNIYPADVEGIASAINDPQSNLEVPAAYAWQGFPALDYLINGADADDAAIVAWYTSQTDGAKRTAYLKRLVARMNTLLSSVITEWNGPYRDTFINRTGLDIGSSTGIVVNGYVLHVERYIRSGKIGIPSGASTGSSGTVYPEKVEAFYKKDISQLLAKRANQAAKDFFNGMNVTTGGEGPSFKSYLDALGARDAASGKMLSEIINEQFVVIGEKLDLLSPDLHDQILSDNQAMINVHAEMQMLVRLLKVDMTSAMSITITYTDNDGD